MKRQDKKTQTAFIERCKKIAMLSKYFETYGCELDEASAVRPYNDHPDWVHKCIEVANDDNYLDKVEYSPMCGVSVDGTEIPTEVLFGGVREMLITIVHAYLDYWKGALLDHTNEMAEAVDYTIDYKELSDDACTEYYELMYYNDRLGWVMSECVYGNLVLDEHADYNELLECLIQQD